MRVTSVGDRITGWRRATGSHQSQCGHENCLNMSSDGSADRFSIGSATLPKKITKLFRQLLIFGKLILQFLYRLWVSRIRITRNIVQN